MAKPRVPMELQSKKVSKEEREARIEAEKKLVGDRDLLLRPPSYLNKQEKKIYKELIKPLLHIESLGNSDREIFAIMANAKAMMIEAKKSIENDGMLIPKMDRFGNVEMKENPCIKIYKDYESIFNKNQSQIGLSASARTKLVQIKQEKEEQSELDNILGALRS
ncbi:phage terminase small subunit P27 family [Clostridium perfringens]|uniref:phage terminase small subunit P27 family n=1 Tax=Clostridium perfringens TaxID=1502 RepID=UPI001DD948A6|nr:phage terminase small subunit P27 family [Clostridium perfringens]EIF6167636.1 phage terminase small subunit P27 family [Clostridium perfringens]ELC8395787.1 phage terminase small subunit P27 family [Clostridium perfringens]MDJ9033067.1 phage terminase small subunit P27 family [Clostridium perfringens]MDK0409052.1 phage terminase small subunit P27 family [Clostridium perfringens]